MHIRSQPSAWWGAVVGCALALVSVSCCSLRLAPARLGEAPEQGVYLGVYGGGHVPLTEWDLNESADLGAEPSPGGMGGVRIGAHALQWLAFEAGVAAVPYLSGGDFNLAIKADFDAVFQVLPRGTWSPYATAGAGIYGNLSGSHGHDTDTHVGYGFGLRGWLHDHVGMRIGLRHNFTDGLTYDLTGQTLEAVVGFDFVVWRKGRDEDGDGVTDRADWCPYSPGPASLGGCPDDDRDGVANYNDECPDQAGPGDLRGCPDGDRDGVADRNDGCPTEPGVVELEGCPDADGDGVADREDKCPDRAGPRRRSGCPDTDLDGMPDHLDRCPNERGPMELGGCPDADGDGLVAEDDKCPAQRGTAARAGCPAEVPADVEKRFSGALAGISFDRGSARLLRRSHRVLDDAVRALKENPTLRLRIEGHTDDQGGEARNQALSRERAKAVKAYLVAQGIDAGRLETAGLGESRPVADNATRRGRARNRRIEFHIISR